MDRVYFTYSDGNGFRGVKAFRDDFGLLFKHSGAMVMDRCCIPLTAIFIDNKMNIVGTTNMTPEPQPPYSSIKYSVDKSYEYVLEVKQNTLNKLDWNIGDRLVIKDNYIYREVNPMKKSFNENTPITMNDVKPLDKALEILLYKYAHSTDAREYILAAFYAFASKYVEHADLVDVLKSKYKYAPTDYVDLPPKSKDIFKLLVENYTDSMSNDDEFIPVIDKNYDDLSTTNSRKNVSKAELPWE